ncbi:DeoR/GlpR family DNA-binding transcription regulator [Marinimicrobium sp. ARAG 43.8]|uniref:DeoR/GlpR family DNA-binding transcription regulator n=1 Tax=Marinimicrobium sp. ARAG 43.8 TaxID=3418719 RepID=UPI003CF3C185
MNKRNTQQRRRAIIDMLAEAGEVSVEHLAHHFGTSEVTVRKDLAALENNGLLLRRYGGAVPLPQEMIIDPGTEKISERKQAMAKAAAELILDHNRVIIDSGTTTAALLPELSRKQGLVVMTNSLNIANALRELENEPTLLMTGGTWDPQSEGFQGKLAEQVLRSYNFDQLFIGADGLDLARGTTTFNELYSLSQVMADVAREVVVMAESDKLGRKIHNLELPWERIAYLVTDADFPESVRRELVAKGVKVILAA